MKKLLLLSALLISISCLSQKQGRTWYFGIQSGLDFLTGTPVNLSDGKTGTDLPQGGAQEGTASLSDSSGKLLFYSGGQTVWNRDHVPMPNGSNLFGGQSSTQSSFIIPVPGSSNLFYLFTSDEFQSYEPQRINKGYRYNIIDMCRDNGKGDVLTNQKNILLLDSCTEKLAACEDADGKGYWLVGHKMFSNAFYSWHITSTGISQPVISKTGTIHGWDQTGTIRLNGSAQGQMKINPQGTKLALALGNYDPSMIDLFNFDNTTGVLNNFCHIAIDSGSYKRSYGVEFSPDGSRLYAEANGGVGGGRLYQYNLLAGDCSSIANSKTSIYQSNLSLIAGMQLAPDNKIYMMSESFHTLARINNPNSDGAAVNFQPVAITLTGVINNYTFPSFIAGFKYHNKNSCYDPVLPTDSSCRLEIDVKFYPSPVNSTLIIKKNPTQCRVVMQLYNGLHQLIIKDKYLNDGLNEIKMSKFPAGIYYYKLISADKTFSGKILKQ